MEKINFKYYPNVWTDNVFSRSEDGEDEVCQCCGETTQYYIDRMYSVKDIACICPKCVANCRATEKFDGDYIQDAEINKVSDKEKIDELFKRTP